MRLKLIIDYFILASYSHFHVVIFLWFLCDGDEGRFVTQTQRWTFLFGKYGDIIFRKPVQQNKNENKMIIGWNTIKGKVCYTKVPYGFIFNL